MATNLREYGDYCGFTFNGRHSSEFNILRVSEGNRYTENTLPSFQDTVVRAPAGNGTYFFSSSYAQKNFTVQIAFDSMTDKEYQDFIRTFNGQDFGDLIFDETPFKAYRAKVANPPQIKLLEFDSEDPSSYARIYKGEGIINFVCYAPFAHSVYKWIDQYPNVNHYRDTWSQWGTYSLKTSTGHDAVGGLTTKVANCGDVETGIRVKFAFTNGACALTSLKMDTGAILNVSRFTKKGNDTHICIDSNTQLIEGYANGVRTGNLYNSNIVSGDFFKIPADCQDHTITAVGANIAALDYQYLYY